MFQIVQVFHQTAAFKNHNFLVYYFSHYGNVSAKYEVF